MQSDGRFVYIVLTRVTPIGWLLGSTNDTNTQNQFTQISKLLYKLL